MNQEIIEILDRCLKTFNLKELQVFDVENIVGDFMSTLYNKDGIKIDYCPKWQYVEIFGLDLDQYKEFRKENGYWIYEKR